MARSPFVLPALQGPRRVPWLSERVSAIGCVPTVDEGIVVGQIPWHDRASAFTCTRQASTNRTSSAPARAGRCSRKPRACNRYGSASPELACSFGTLHRTVLEPSRHRERLLRDCVGRRGTSANRTGRRAGSSGKEIYVRIPAQAGAFFEIVARRDAESTARRHQGPKVRWADESCVRVECHRGGVDELSAQSCRRC